MKIIFLITIIFFLILSSQNLVQAQSKIFLVNGKVFSPEGAATVLEGVSVHVKGMTQYTGSAPDGLFTLGVPTDNNILVLELYGYITREITISCSKAYDIVLQKANTNSKIKNTSDSIIVAKQ